MSSWQWIIENVDALSLLIAAIPIMWALVEYIRRTSIERRQLRFENYHRLVRELVQGEGGNRTPYLDRQLAVVFELQRYREYRVPSVRILHGFRVIVERLPGQHSERLLEQIDDTLRVLE